MTQYLIYATQDLCLARTHSEAVARGCASDGETQYWWAQIQHPSNGRWALVIPDNDIAGLSSAEQASAQTVSQMTTAGWTL